jgi:hypothetical protein
MASNTRSTASDAKAAGSETRGTSRVSAYARASSPARAGAMLLTIMPIAVDRQSGPYGSPAATGSRMVRQRRARSGKISVAATVEASHSAQSDARTAAHTAPNG